MVWMGKENRVDGRDGDDVVIVAFVNKVINEVVNLMKCGVDLLVFVLLLVVGVGIALFSHYVARHCGVAVVQSGGGLASSVLQ